VKVIENAVIGRLSVSEAARLLQLSERQVRRLKRRFCPDSVAWVHRGNRGRPMPWALPAALRRTIVEMARDKYVGFNDSHLFFGKNCGSWRTCSSVVRPCAASCGRSGKRSSGGTSGQRACGSCAKAGHKSDHSRLKQPCQEML